MDEQHSRLACDAISHAAEMVKYACFAAIASYERPSVLYKPALFPDGNQWCALYGEDLQMGVAGFGDTPENAMVDFDNNWSRLEARKENRDG